MSQDEVLFEAEERMEKCVEHLQNDLRGIKSGRATPGLVEGIKVDYYGSATPLKQLANIGPVALSTAIAPYPTEGEVWKKLGDAHQRSRLGPRLAAFLRRYFGWVR